MTLDEEFQLYSAKCALLDVILKKPLTVDGGWYADGQGGDPNAAAPAFKLLLRVGTERPASYYIRCAHQGAPPKKFVDDHDRFRQVTIHRVPVEKFIEAIIDANGPQTKFFWG